MHPGMKINGGIFTSDSPYLSLIEFSKIKKYYTVEQQYNLGNTKKI